MTEATSATIIKFQRVKLLTRPTLKIEVGITHYVKVERAMYLGKDIESKRGRPASTEEKKAPATILDVIDLQHGNEPSQIVCNTVIVGILNDNYPDNSYVGKSFAITKLDKKPGKDYFPFNVEEIQLTGETTAPVAAESAAPTSAESTSTAPPATPRTRR